jgi:pSer/pThr/pTyr-binding forkhead associated (FHA) protein
MQAMSTPSLVLKKVSNGQEMPIAGPISVGRSEDSNLRLLEGQPSRHHAAISTDGAQVFVEDLGSTNGTFVNDRRLDIKVKVKLNAGDRLRFDTEEFVLRDTAPAAAAAPPIDSDKTQFRAPPPRQAEQVVAAPTVRIEPPPAKSEARPAKSEPPPVKGESPPIKGESPAPSTALPGAFGNEVGNKTVFVPKKAKPKAAAEPDGWQPASGDHPYLLMTSGDKAGGRIELPVEGGAKKQWSIGSGSDRNICFAETGVSAKHASLTHDNNRWLLVDDLSVSGTYVNDTKTLRSYLSDGDRLMFGPVECVFRMPAPKAEQSESGARLKKIAIILAIACAVTLALIFIVFKLPK